MRAAPPELNRQILEEATEWFIDFRVGDVDEAASQRFEEWLRRSPEHIRAYWEIAKTYVELPPISSSRRHNVEELIAGAKFDATDNVVPLNPPSRPFTAGESNPLRVQNEAFGAGRRLPRQRLLWAAAAMFLLLIAGPVWWQSHRYPVYATDVGERRSITLDDGSTVDLNARTKLRVELSSTERRVELLQGQALFQVAKDKLRPFLVQSGDALVRAVGTQFDVYRKDSGTTVTVLEGRVAVYSTQYRDPSASGAGSDLGNTVPNAAGPPPHPRVTAKESSSNSTSAPVRGGAKQNGSSLAEPSDAAAVLVYAGQQVTLSPAAGTPAPQRADLSTATAWTQHKLIFEGSRLSDVAAEFNRYNTLQLVIADSRIEDFEISGVYSSTDPSSLLRFLRDQGLKVTEADNEVRVEAQ